MNKGRRSVWLKAPEVWRESYVDYCMSPDPRVSTSLNRCNKGDQVITSDRHSGGFNAVFGDGHAKWRKFGSTQPCQWSIQADPCFGPGNPG